MISFEVTRTVATVSDGIINTVTQSLGQIGKAYEHSCIFDLNQMLNLLLHLTAKRAQLNEQENVELATDMAIDPVC